MADFGTTPREAILAGTGGEVMAELNMEALILAELRAWDAELRAWDAEPRAWDAEPDVYPLPKDELADLATRLALKVKDAALEDRDRLRAALERLVDEIEHQRPLDFAFGANWADGIHKAQDVGLAVLEGRDG